MSVPLRIVPLAELPADVPDNRPITSNSMSIDGSLVPGVGQVCISIPARYGTRLRAAATVVALTIAAHVVPARAESRHQLEAEATAAISAALSSGGAAQFRELGTWVQRPGEATVCGEVSTDADGGRWRAFFAARDTPGGWHALSPQAVQDGWRFGVNPTNVTGSDQAACSAEMSRAPAGGGRPTPSDVDLMRRCPMEASVFWTDHAMTCAGHVAPD